MQRLEVSGAVPLYASLGVKGLCIRRGAIHDTRELTGVTL